MISAHGGLTSPGASLHPTGGLTGPPTQLPDTSDRSALLPSCLGLPVQFGYRRKLAEAEDSALEESLCIDSETWQAPCRLLHGSLGGTSSAAKGSRLSPQPPHPTPLLGTVRCPGVEPGVLVSRGHTLPHSSISPDEYLVTSSKCLFLDTLTHPLTGNHSLCHTFTSKVTLAELVPSRKTGDFLCLHWVSWSGKLRGFPQQGRHCQSG